MLANILQNPIAWIIIVLGVIWAGKSIKDFFNWRKLNSLKVADKKLNDQIHKLEGVIQEKQKNVDVVPLEEAKKSPEAAEDFWKKLDQ